MVETVTRMKWGVERRLEFIEFRLLWEGGVNRSDIMATFDVSEPQASKDLTLYQERAPGNAIYDKNARRYIASTDFRSAFLRHDPIEYLQRLRALGEGFVDPADSWLGARPDVDVVLTPAREVKTDILRAVLKALRDGSSLEVLYQSMNRENPEPVWRTITPHAFGYDGIRWHVRSYCQLTDQFKDFILPRILGTGKFAEPGRPGSDDELWCDRFDVVIGPHPDLSPTQKAIVAKDFGMSDGATTVLPVRYAMLFYVLKRLGLLHEPEKRPARSQHIVVVNRKQTDDALQKANFSL